MDRSSPSQETNWKSEAKSPDLDEGTGGRQQPGQGGVSPPGRSTSRWGGGVIPSSDPVDADQDRAAQNGNGADKDKKAGLDPTRLLRAYKVLEERKQAQAGATEAPSTDARQANSPSTSTAEASVGKSIAPDGLGRQAPGSQASHGASSESRQGPTFQPTGRSPGPQRAAQNPSTAPTTSDGPALPSSFDAPRSSPYPSAATESNWRNPSARRWAHDRFEPAAAQGRNASPPDQASPRGYLPADARPATLSPMPPARSSPPVATSPPSSGSGGAASPARPETNDTKLSQASTAAPKEPSTSTKPRRPAGNQTHLSRWATPQEQTAAPNATERLAALAPSTYPNAPAAAGTSRASAGPSSGAATGGTRGSAQPEPMAARPGPGPSLFKLNGAASDFVMPQRAGTSAAGDGGLVESAPVRAEKEKGSTEDMAHQLNNLAISTPRPQRIQSDEKRPARSPRRTPFLPPADQARLASGGQPRVRKSEKELDELMARMKLKNEEELERNAAAKKDREAYEASQADKDARAAIAQRRIRDEKKRNDKERAREAEEAKAKEERRAAQQKSINEERARAAAAKLAARSGRAWDLEKPAAGSDGASAPAPASSYPSVEAEAREARRRAQEAQGSAFAASRVERELTEEEAEQIRRRDGVRGDEGGWETVVQHEGPGRAETVIR